MRLLNCRNNFQKNHSTLRFRSKNLDSLLKFQKVLENQSKEGQMHYDRVVMFDEMFLTKIT